MKFVVNNKRLLLTIDFINKKNGGRMKFYVEDIGYNNLETCKLIYLKNVTIIGGNLLFTSVIRGLNAESLACGLSCLPLNSHASVIKKVN